MTNLDSIFKSRDITLPTNVCLVKAMVFPVVIYGDERWTVKKAVLKNWCFWTVVLEKTLENPLDYKEIQPVHPKGDQSWVFIGRTDVEAVWPPDVKNWLIWKGPNVGKDWRWDDREEWMTENETVGWYRWSNGYAAAAAAAKSLQLCPTLCDPVDSSPPGSPVPGILQAKTLEWVANSGS